LIALVQAGRSTIVRKNCSDNRGHLYVTVGDGRPMIS
jgi:hypothetical protein